MDIEQQINDLKKELASTFKHIGFEELKSEHSELLARSQTSNFWQDNQAAQTTMQRLAKVTTQVEPWQKLSDQIDDLQELAAMGDKSLHQDLEKQYAKVRESFDNLQQGLVHSGPYDNYNVLLGIYAGAGGTDAQDWAQMLLRMYVRWAEKVGYQVHVVEESAGDEAGIKSATLEIAGDQAYGKLKGEHGVHRLVRLSPFNANNLRQTSFAKLEVLPKVDQPDTVPIDEKELKIDVFRAGGHGGQSVNTTDSAVRITHLPTGIVVSIQNERSQLQNKETAMTLLRSKLAQLQLEQHLETIAGLKGPNQSAEWGNQIRSYVLHPYKQVKDLRTRHETSNAEAVLDGDLDPFLESYGKYIASGAKS